MPSIKKQIEALAKFRRGDKVWCEYDLSASPMTVVDILEWRHREGFLYDLRDADGYKRQVNERHFRSTKRAAEAALRRMK